MTRSGWPRQIPDRGSGSVLVVGGTAAVLTVLVAVLVVVSALLAAHTARDAADLAALAGAQESVLGASSAEACQVASDVARANDARLTGCDVGPGSVITVDAESEVRLPLAAISPPAMRGRAKAGPAPDGS